MRTLSLVAISVLLGGCAASGEREEAAPKQTAPLELWSHHKLLQEPVAACGDKAVSALKSLGFANVVRNGDYAYGNYQGSRAAVKCVEMPEGSFVYFAVASTTREAAEKLRNQISTKL